ncbi:hypothetical protein HS088_TW18G00449 [Tripterygium wilfordii]|uniref:Uncharacterized protein n=1 Tax=Tripterygium wilfordii TaxID=458696 RepID=A0A7J7CC66_TRIWF|nr:hypothetical protein HS088_TW18G00449 [Tripterygium wilfordii]
MDNPPRSSSSAARTERHGPRSRWSRFLLSKNRGYILLISPILICVCFLFLFQMLLPDVVVEEKSGSSLRVDETMDYGNLIGFEEMEGLDFGESVRFEPSNILKKFKKEDGGLDPFNRIQQRFDIRKPQLALVQ